MFIRQALEDPTYFVTVIVVVTFSVSFHECAHAWMAYRQGDSTAVDEGHLTLNPIKQMGLLSIAMLLLLGIAWGAVPVRPAYMRRPWSHALVAFAGPAANLLLAVVFGILCAASLRLGGDGNPYIQFMYVGAVLNVVLFVFNMLPIPILDGYTIYSYFIPALQEVSSEVKNAIFLFIFLGFGFVGSYLFAFAHSAVSLFVSIIA